jgi:uncharacterized protein YodC (DUF2158 family)
MTNEMKIGDVVRLKSGGPEMTILDYSNDGEGEGNPFLCCWFEPKSATYEEVELTPAALVLVGGVAS